MWRGLDPGTATTFSARQHLPGTRHSTSSRFVLKCHVLAPCRLLRVLLYLRRGLEAVCDVLGVPPEELGGGCGQHFRTPGSRCGRLRGLRIPGSHDSSAGGLLGRVPGIACVEGLSWCLPVPLVEVWPGPSPSPRDQRG